MKKMDFFCASPSSTAICSSMVDHRRPLDRRGHRHRPVIDRLHAPCNSSQLPIIPKPAGSYYHEKSRKSSAKPSDHHSYLRRKSSANITDLSSSGPTGSSRYLLSDKPFIDWLSESESDQHHLHHHHHRHHHHHDALALVPSSNITTQPSKPRHLTTNHSPAFKSSSSTKSRDQVCHDALALVPSSNITTQTSKPRHVTTNHSPALKSSSSTKPRDQVVVLRVSIHCKGCEGKVRKHISKMEGVTSFSIDLDTKKVTVIGNVTPLGVLASVSKVKNAQFWPSSTSSSSSSPSPSSSLVNMSY